MYRVLIADKIAPEAIEVLARCQQIQVESRPGLTEEQLAQLVGEYDAMIIRSGVKVTGKVLAHAGRLRAIARAGVGVDNVDLQAATRAGIVVMNTPDANTISTAEHTIGMMLALSRNIVQSCNDTRAGGWNRSRFVGSQLAGKTLGIVGLGRVGRAVASRALAMEMTVIAYDPLFTGQSALDGKVKFLGELDQLLRDCDYLSVHVPGNPQTKGMIGAEQLALMKPTARVINCARGGIIDEQALYEALSQGRLAGAALDVFESEPPKGNPLLTLDNVTVTCHLGASTREAQRAVAEQAAQLLVDYLVNGQVRSAVNVTGLPAAMTELEKAGVDLVRRMARLIGAMVDKGVKSVAVNASGLDRICPFLARVALVEILNRFLAESLNVVNAELLASQRGIEFSFTCQSAKEGARPKVRLELAAPQARHCIEGTVDQDKLPTILNIDGYHMNMVPEGNMVVLFNDDQPGVIGLVGTTFGRHGVNIADLTLSRRGERALMVFKIDSPAPDGAIEQLRQSRPPIQRVSTVNLAAVQRS